MSKLIVREIVETIYEIPENMSESEAVHESVVMNSMPRISSLKWQYEFIGGGK